MALITMRRGCRGFEGAWAMRAACAAGLWVALGVGIAWSQAEGELRAGTGGPATLSLEYSGPLLPMADRYLDIASGEKVSSDAGGAGVAALPIVRLGDEPSTGLLAELSLRGCVDLALENNLTLVNARRDVDISRSQLRESEAFFIPFVDLVGSSTYKETRTESPAKESGTSVVETDRTRTTSNSQSAKTEAGVNLPTGGKVTASAGPTRTRGTTGTGPQGSQTAYKNEFDMRLSQPLLRGAGFDVGTADLRQSRLSQMNQELAYRLQERDVVLQVIQQYFALLQASQDLRVSTEALLEKSRFLEETRIKFQKGRIAESEILRAELQHLQEEETSVSRRRTLEDRLERLVLTLGLYPGTPVSVQDVTPLLTRRGRVEIPALEEAITLGLNSRLELLQSEIAVEQSRISLSVARKNILPDLNATTGYTTSDTDRTMGGATDLEDNSWDAGLELRIPLPNIGRREALRRAQLSYEKVKTLWKDRERQVAQEIKNSHRSVKTAEMSLLILDKTVEQARKNLDLVNGQFDVGFVTITEVRLAQDDLFEAESRQSNTLLNYQVSIAQYYIASGQPLL